jgi:hypothetical protein
MVYDAAFGVGQRGLFDWNDVGDDRPDAALQHAIISASPHASTEKDFAISNAFRHPEVALVRSRAEAVRLAWWI